MIKAALVTCGLWEHGLEGRELARALSEMGSLATVCALPGDMEGEAANAYGVSNLTSFSDILDDPAATAVLIAAPTSLGTRLCRSALAAGKDVLILPPMALTAEDANSLTRMAAEQQRILMVGHMRRHDAAFLALHDLVSRGELGRVRYITIRRMGDAPKDSGAPDLQSFISHDISIVLALAGTPPQRVETHVSEPSGGTAVNVATTHLFFADGLRAEICLARHYPWKESNLVVIGDRCIAVLDDTKPADCRLMIYDRATNRWDGRPIAVEAGTPLRMALEHFLYCCRTRTSPLTDGAEGERVLTVLLSDRTVPAAPALVERFPNALIHPTAEVDNDVAIGDRTRIWHFSHILRGTRIGADCSFGQNCCIGANVTIGNGCRIQNNVSIYDGATLEDDVFCGPSCVFTNVLTPRAFISRKNEFLPTLVRRGASIGANATVVCGTTLGRYCLIGAGAVVTRDVPDYALMVGNPARRIGWVSETGDRLGADLVCPRTRERYEETPDGHLRKIAAPNG